MKILSFGLSGGGNDTSPGVFIGVFGHRSTGCIYEMDICLFIGVCGLRGRREMGMDW